jgi:hypothetical protein
MALIVMNSKTLEEPNPEMIYIKEGSTDLFPALDVGINKPLKGIFERKVH